MNEHDLPAFSRGAEWVRADFHLHTIKDPGASRKPFRDEYRGDEDGHPKANRFPKDWIGRLKEEGVRVAVVTNHNHFDREEYKVLRKLGAKDGILVLPGVELGLKDGGGGIHALFVFNPDGWVANPGNDDKINRFLAGQFSSPADEGCRTKDGFCDCLALLDDLKEDYFVVFAHAQSSNGIFSELEGGNLQHFIDGCGKRWQERVLGLDQVTRPDLVAARWTSDLSPPAFVEGSDPKCMAEVGRDERRCYLKIGELSFESVKFALHDWRQRVSASFPDTDRQPGLHRISFKGGRLNDQEFSLSDQLTCLIGSRGSGKSSVVECLRYGLGLDPGESDMKYKNSLVSAMLANGGEVAISGVNPEGFAFEIRRSLGYEPVVRLEGKDTRLRPGDVLPGLLYFGQKDLGHRHPSFEDDLFPKLLNRHSAAERSLEEVRISAVKQAVEEWRSVLRASEKEKEYAQEEERLRHQLAVYREKGVEKQLERLTTFDADKRDLADFIGKTQTLRHKLELAPDDWEEVVNDWPSMKSELLVFQAERLDGSRVEFDAVRADHSAFLARFDGLLVSLRNTLGSLLEKERELQEEFAALQREIDAPGLNLEEFRARKSHHEQLVKLLKAAGNRKEMAAQSLAQVEDTARVLYDLWRQWHREEVQELERKKEPLPSSLDLSIQFEGNRDEFKAFLKSKFTGSGIRTSSLDKLVEEFSNGFTLFQRRNELDEVLGGSADVAKCHHLLLEHLAEILTYRVPDKRFIWFNEVPIQNLSLGQRATALLQLLMGLEGHPVYLIDQPEDDLDNETIFRHVVEPLLRVKTRSQFIIATHNPNIPVLGDAELVHACREEGKGSYSHASGSLDSTSTREAIVSIMEGGAQAFEQRQKIYSQWTNSL
jgi:predicted ATPase